MIFSHFLLDKFPVLNGVRCGVTGVYTILFEVQNMLRYCVILVSCEEVVQVYSVFLELILAIIFHPGILLVSTRGVEYLVLSGGDTGYILKITQYFRWDLKWYFVRTYYDLCRYYQYLACI